MDKNIRKVLTWTVVFVVLILVIGYGVKEWRLSGGKVTEDRGVVAGEHINKKGQKWTIPEGKYEFQVSSAEEYPQCPPESTSAARSWPLSRLAGPAACCACSVWAESAPPGGTPSGSFQNRPARQTHDAYGPLPQ